MLVRAAYASCRSAAAHHVRRLVDVGILQEVTGKDRNRVFVAWEIVDLL